MRILLLRSGSRRPATVHRSSRPTGSSGTTRRVASCRRALARTVSCGLHLAVRERGGSSQVRSATP